MAMVKSRRKKFCYYCNSFFIVRLRYTKIDMFRYFLPRTRNVYCIIRLTGQDIQAILYAL